MSLLWYDEIRHLKFSPAEVERMTGVTTVRQRAIASRYLDFRTAPIDVGRRKIWRWYGVQALMIFSEIVADLGDASIAAQNVGDLVGSSSTIFAIIQMATL